MNKIIKSLLPLTLATFMLTGCGNKISFEKHVIPYPTNMETTKDELGADYADSRLDHPDTKYYSANNYYSMKPNETLHIVRNFKTYQQTTEYTAGPASTLMILHHYGVDDYTEMDIAERTKTDNTTGTTVENICAFLGDIGLKCNSHADTNAQFETIEEAEKFFINLIDADMPIMVNWEDWGGHWQVLIGIDTCGTESCLDDVMIFADPYDITDHYQDGYYTYSLGRFFYQWKEGAMLQKENPYVQPFIVIYKDFT